MIYLKSSLRSKKINLIFLNVNFGGPQFLVDSQEQQLCLPFPKSGPDSNDDLYIVLTFIFLKLFQLEVFKKANDKMTKSNTFVNSLESGIERVRKLKNFALIAESAMAKYYTKQKPCDIYMVGDFTTLGNMFLKCQTKLTRSQIQRSVGPTSSVFNNRVPPPLNLLKVYFKI